MQALQGVADIQQDADRPSSCRAVLHCAAGQPWSCCPRSALKRALSSLESRFGLTLMVGFELEFVLLKPAPLELFRCAACWLVPAEVVLFARGPYLEAP